MSIFNQYNKPGPGIEKNNGYEATGFSMYFQLLFRKFWDICHLSIIICLFTIPYIALSYGVYCILGNVFTDSWLFRVLLSFAPFLLYGPVLGAGYKITRDFVRGEPVFMFADCWKAIKENVKKTVGLSAILGFLSMCLCIALPFYFSMGGVGSYVCFPLCLLAAIAIVFMQFYGYTMATSLELTVKEMLKNSLILSFIAIGRNVLILFIMLLVAAILIGLSIAYQVMIGFALILLLCVVPGLFFYSAAFITHPVLQRYIIDPYYQANPQKTSAVLSNNQSLHDDNTVPPQKELPEYVYHNGRMIHRSVLESESLFDDQQKIPTNNDK